MSDDALSMAMKRSRPETPHSIARSKRPKVDHGLAEIWNTLADECEDVRLTAAVELINKYCNNADQIRATTIAQRLFRGLCSSRKAARPGFYVALVGALSVKPNAFGASEPVDIISILESETAPEPDTSGQDERDHHFGRLLGCHAIIESKFLDASVQPGGVYRSLAALITQVMAAKPWLRREASSILCAMVQSIAAHSLAGSTALEVIKCLEQTKLLRTMDGIAVWLQIQESFPKASMPHSVWAGENPLHVKELPKLKKAILDIQDGDEELLGTSSWSPSLHPVWSNVLHKFSASVAKSQITFQQFWKEVVDDGLFHPVASTERKCIGFIFLGLALGFASVHDIPICFSQNVVASLTQALRAGNDAYLGKVAMQALVRVTEEPATTDNARIDTIICSLLRTSGYADFDTLVSSKLVNHLFRHTLITPVGGVGKELLSWLKGRDQAAKVDLSHGQKINILNVLQRALIQQVRLRQDKTERRIYQDVQLVNATGHVLQSLDGLKSLWDVDASGGSASNELGEKILVVMESLLAAGNVGQAAFLSFVESTQKKDLSAQAEIKDLIEEAWKQFRSLAEQSEKSRSGTDEKKQMLAFATMLGSVLHEIGDGDIEGVEILPDMTDIGRDLVTNNSSSKVADHIVDLAMSFMSKPLKFHRRVAELAFDAFTSDMTVEGLQALIEVINSKEGREGQLDLFESGIDDVEDDGSSTELSIDSDVEIVEVDEEQASSEDDDGTSIAESQTSETSSQPDSIEDSAEEELTRFESALAAALGTRKLTQDDVNDDSSGQDSGDLSSDSDMSDSEMMELDEKLAEVFRNQQTLSSAQKQKKDEMKNAKENIINLKNRALDLIEIFLKTQQLRGLECISLLQSLLEMASATASPQLANRGVTIIGNYVTKVRRNKLPLVVGRDVRQTTRLHDHLLAVHAMVAKTGTSNALIEATGQLHLLLCKVLVQAGVKDMKAAVSQAATDTGSRNDLQRKAVQQFWSRYDAWLITLHQSETISSKGRAKDEVAVGGTGNGLDESNNGEKKKKTRKRSKAKQ